MSYLLFTQTFVDQDLLSAIAVEHYLKHGFRLDGFSPDSVAADDYEKYQKLAHDYKQQKILIAPDFKTKADFRAQMSKIYNPKYTQKSILCLGSISDYSIETQEAMLKLIEEPPTNLDVLIFAHRKDEILPTILSRTTQIRLSEKFIASIFDKIIFDSTKSKMPPVSEYLKNLLTDKHSDIDPKELERQEIDLFLWQLATNLEHVLANKFLDENHLQQNSQNIIKKGGAVLERIMQSRKMNWAGVQKKFVLANLWID